MGEGGMEGRKNVRDGSFFVYGLLFNLNMQYYEHYSNSWYTTVSNCPNNYHILNIVD